MGDMNSGVTASSNKVDPAGMDTGVNRSQMISGFTDPRLQALMSSLFPQFSKSPSINAPVQQGPEGGVQMQPNPAGSAGGTPMSTNPSPMTAGPSSVGGGAPFAGPNPFSSLLAANPVASPIAAGGGGAAAGAPASPAAMPFNPAATNVAIDPTAAFIMSLFGGSFEGAKGAEPGGTSGSGHDTGSGGVQ